jgi:hypothetical protein
MQVEKVRGVSDTSGIDRPRSIEGPEPKASQTAAGYGDSSQKCNTCVHFDGTNSCDKVEGDIDPDGHSKYYERSETAAGDTPLVESKDEDDDEYYPR